MSRTSAAVDERLPGSGDMSEAFSVDECSRASPSSKVRAMIATSKPASASATAVALPIPRLAPVTNATSLSSCWLSAPGTVTVSVSRPDRSNVPARSPVSRAVGDDLAAVDQHVLDALRLGVEPLAPAGQVVAHLRRAAADAGRVEHDEIGDPPLGDAPRSRSP